MKSSRMKSKKLKKVTGKCNTSKPLTEVKKNSPYGIKWEWEDKVPTLAEQGSREEMILRWVQECTNGKIWTHSTKITPTGVEIRMTFLLDLPLLIQETHHNFLPLVKPFLIHDIGPWKQGNMLMVVEFFFQTHAYHPFATCGNTNHGMTGSIPMSRISTASTPHQKITLVYICCLTLKPHINAYIFSNFYTTHKHI